MDNDKSQLIKNRAYELWELEGRPEGKHEHHWRTAEQEVAEKGNVPPVKPRATAPVPKVTQRKPRKPI
ncbi:hypothetical protein QFZ34_000387 [Phyllobacterium ifriqiyense]|uniref:DUF2934 domain-containing protein n=1 Tax=Phyllobacterium ifriqiyense TaxID=314238 RepID=A0ABU0S364_9HYPH|nr:DUF2934 domain-containing protein [Phyllobacterium ifriqiyense]MDQ0995210.1 hypothetical protein [Phyllobacterium ifriqiyense]